jgi:hypothetical protein
MSDADNSAFFSFLFFSHVHARKDKGRGISTRFLLSIHQPFFLLFFIIYVVYYFKKIN